MHVATQVARVNKTDPKVDDATITTIIELSLSVLQLNVTVFLSHVWKEIKTIEPKMRNITINLCRQFVQSHCASKWMLPATICVFNQTFYSSLSLFFRFTGRSLHVTSCALINPKWRRDRGLPEQLNQYGPLTDRPDYTYLDGRPTPLGVSTYLP